MSSRNSSRDSDRISSRDSDKISSRNSSRESDKISSRNSSRESDRISSKVSSNKSDKISSRNFSRDSDRISSKVSSNKSDKISSRNSSRDSDRISSKVSSNKSDNSKSESDRISSRNSSGESGCISDCDSDQVSDKKEVEVSNVGIPSENTNSEHNHLKLKRFKFNSGQILKNNLFIANYEMHDNIELLMKILYNINKNSYIDNIEEIYNNNVKFVINPDDKKEYKKILLENPYSYFNKFSFSKSLSEKDNSNTLKQLYIVDYDYIQTDEELLKKANKMMESKSILNQFIFISSSINIDVKSDDTLIKSSIIMHNVELLRVLQKQFYKKIIKKYVNNPEVNSWNEFKTLLNVNDIKTLIINNGVLKYN